MIVRAVPVISANGTKMPLMKMSGKRTRAANIMMLLGTGPRR